MVDIWDGFIGVFEDKGDWIPDPDTIDLDLFDGEGIDFIRLKIKSWDLSEDPDLKKKNIVNKNTGFFGLKATDLVVALVGWVRKDNTYESEENLQFISNFQRSHVKISDESAYLVMRTYRAAAWVYGLRWEDNEGNTDLKYTKGKLGLIRSKKTKFGRIDYSTQFHEGWLG